WLSRLHRAGEQKEYKQQEDHVDEWHHRLIRRSAAWFVKLDHGLNLSTLAVATFLAPDKRAASTAETNACVFEPFSAKIETVRSVRPSSAFLTASTKPSGATGFSATCVVPSDINQISTTFASSGKPPSDAAGVATVNIC